MSQRTSNSRIPAEKKVFLRKGSGAKPTPRPVGNEARVAKPAPKGKAQPKPTPPTYEEQDQEAGSQDSEVEELEDDVTDDEETQTVAPPANLASTSRSKTTSRRPAPAIKARTAATESHPAHMKMMMSIMDYKSSPGKPVGITEHFVSFDKLIEINEPVTRILLSKKEVRKANPGYNAIFSRTAIVLCGYLVILQAREAASSISDEEHKVLKRIRASIPFNQILIPSPYILALQGLGYHIPSDKKFDRVVPALPAIGHIIEQTENVKTGNPIRMAAQAYATGYPSIPHLFALMSLVVDESVDFTKETNLKDYASPKPNTIAANPHIQNGSLIPFRRDLDYGTSFTFLGVTNDSAPTSTSFTSWLALNAALIRPIPARPKEINEVSDHIPTFPEARWKTGFKVATLMDFFIASKSLEWMNRAFEALAYESKFFEGASTLESIGFERGPESLAPVEIALDTSATFSGTGWFPEMPYDEEPFSTSSKREAVTETDLQIALYQKTIIKYKGTVSNFHRNGTDLATGAVFTEGYLRRRIQNVPDLRPSMHLTIETEMLKDISTCL